MKTKTKQKHEINKCKRIENEVEEYRVTNNSVTCSMHIYAYIKILLLAKMPKLLKNGT